MLLDFRIATLKDLNQIIEVIESARSSLREREIPQWLYSYPNSSNIEADINAKMAYVAEIGSQIVGYVNLTLHKLEEYEEDTCKWKESALSYSAIHRLAVKREFQNLKVASLILKEIDLISESLNEMVIRLDTHEENIPMQKMLLSLGYFKCGWFNISDGDEVGEKRICYEKRL